MYSWNNKVEIQINSEKSPFLFFCILIWTLNNFQWWFIKGAVVETNRMALNGTLKTLPPKKQKKQKTKLMKHSSVIQQRRSCSKLRTQQMGGSRIPPEWRPNGSSKFRASAQLQWCSSSTSSSLMIAQYTTSFPYLTPLYSLWVHFVLLWLLVSLVGLFFFFFKPFVSSYL